MALTAAENKELQDINYGILPEPSNEKYIFRHKKSKKDKFVRTNFFALSKNILANCIYTFVLRQGYLRGDDFLFNVQDYAAHVKKSVPTIRKAIKALIDLDLCIMIKRPGKATLFFFSRYAFSTQEKQKILSENHAQKTYASDGSKARKDSTEQKPENTHIAPQVKNLPMSTYSSKIINNIYNNNNSNYAKYISNPVPNVVVDRDNFERIEKKHDSPVIAKIDPEAVEKADKAIKKINPDDRAKIDKSLLIRFNEPFTADQLADRCIYAINKFSFNEDPNGYLRRLLENPEWKIKKQNHYTDFDDIPECHKNWKFDRQKFEDTNERVKAIAEKNRKKSSGLVENVSRETISDSPKPVAPPVVGSTPGSPGASYNQEETKKFMDEVNLSGKLRKDLSLPKPDPKYQGRKKYWDRVLPNESKKKPKASNDEKKRELEAQLEYVRRLENADKKTDN